LGAILYFILFGKPPVEAVSTGDSDSSPAGHKSAGVPSETSAGARSEWTGGARSRRTTNNKVPPALEATCLKALSRDPEMRYPTAQALASDVSAFLDGLSVSAYRESTLEKAARFVARNRPLVILILAYLVMRFLVMIFFRR